MRIVLDTNVLVSGLLSPHGPPAAIVRLVAQGDLILYYDTRVLTEYRSVLLRPAFPFAIAQVESLLDLIEANGQLCGASPLATSLPDPDDEMFLEIALMGEVDYLVTGNLRHYPAKCRQGCNVVAPAWFVEWYRTKE